MATIDDVAKRAGVSASTVSYALSGKRPISAETRRRVERAIKALDYRPHAGARALASSRTEVVGLLAPLRSGVDVNVIMQFVAGVVTGASERGYDVLLLTQDDRSNISRVASASMVDALVVMDIEADDPRLPALRALRQPVVLIGLPADPHGLTCIDLDFTSAGHVAARHLLERGHTRLALLGSPPEVVERHTTYAERMNHGFTAACEAAGARALLQPTAATVAGANASVDAVLEQMPDVTGIVVHNEVALPHVLARLRWHGRTVPDDVSVVALCPENTAVSLPEPVTSVDLPAETIGRLAADMVITGIDGGQPLEVRLLSPTLTDRGSTRAVTPGEDPTP